MCSYIRCAAVRPRGSIRTPLKAVILVSANAFHSCSTESPFCRSTAAHNCAATGGMIGICSLKSGKKCFREENTGHQANKSQEHTHIYDHVRSASVKVANILSEIWGLVSVLDSLMRRWVEELGLGLEVVLGAISIPSMRSNSALVSLSIPLGTCIWVYPLY
jgi:hypothetical protein